MCVLLCGAVATAVWKTLFPHCFWFVILWAGFVTGGAIGMLPGVAWQFQDPARIRRTSGRLVIAIFIGWSAFGVFAIAWLGPDFKSQESQRSRLRSLATDEVEAIAVGSSEQTLRRIDDAASVDQFLLLIQKADLYEPSHEGSILHFQLDIHLRNGRILKYAGRVPERHSDDFFLTFRGALAWHEVIVPDGRRWLDSALIPVPTK
jgi:hypothetical protein